MRDVAFAVPGPLDAPTGGYVYDRRMIAELEALGHAVEVIELAAAFPDATAAERDAAVARLGAVGPEAALVVDGLAFGVLAANEIHGRERLVALVHHPLALETGLSADEAAAFFRSERAALETAAEVIVTSQHTEEVLRTRYGVGREKITVALPGIDAAWFAVERSPQSLPLIVSVGSVTPRKGHVDLIAALAAIADLPWQAVIAGSLDLSPPTVARVRREIADRGLSERVSLIGNVGMEEIAALYARARTFALATHYEGFGMVFAEAMAAGVPIVGTKAGAVTSLVPQDAGLLSEVGDAEAFAANLRAVIADDALADRFSHGGRTAARALPSWADGAAGVSAVLERLA